ncbi:MAG: SAM-dependent methyltransferase [Clostridia bacterium]|nr:SAM-dependent methyltransferase [Clostridia bacterium]
MDNNEKLSAFAGLVQRSLLSGGLVNVVFHSPVSGCDALKAKGTVKTIAGKPVLQVETSLTEGRVTHENLGEGEIVSVLPKQFDVFRKADLTDKNGTASVMISKKGAVTLLEKGKIGTAVNVSAEESGENRGNDREKSRLLTGKEEFLIALGVADKNGRIHDKKQAKFRQICRFSEYIAEAAVKLKPDGELYVCDLCCGKSYLSFAAYHVLTAVLGRQVKMSCVDLKKSVIDYCADIAKQAGMDGMDFICGDINEFVPLRTPDLVISLHACDIATDIVLNFAVRHHADAILSTPCCHHQMNREMDCPTLSFIAERPVLRQKLADAATDALRLLMLDAAGYKTDATEFIDPEDTPKNIMLRAHRRKNWREDSREAADRRERYRAAYFFMYGKYPD